MKFVPKDLDDTADNSVDDQSFRYQAILVGSGLLLVVTIFFSLQFVSNITAAFIPDAWEKKIFSGFNKEERKESDDGLNERADNAEAIFQRLLAATQLRDLNYQLRFNSSEIPNAFAYPGGGVVLTDDMLDMVESDIGVATVLAHEIGHHQRRHVVRKLSGGVLFTFARAIIFGDSALLGAVGNALLLSYSRDVEREADTEAVRLVYRVFGTTEGAAEFFEKIQERDLGLKWLSTHPGTEERIKFFREWRP